MTTDETTRIIDTFLGKRQELLRKLEHAARAVVPVLLDADRKNSAAELQELFFQIDAADQEMAKFFSENAMLSLEVIMRKFEKS